MLPSIESIKQQRLKISMTQKDLANLVGGQIITIPDRPGEPKNSSADVRKIKRELRWEPLVKFDDGIKHMLENLNRWKDAPLWTPKKIKIVTHNWFKYLKKK